MEKKFNYIIFIILLVSTIAISNEPFAQIAGIPINFYRIFIATLYCYIWLYTLIKRKNFMFLIIYTLFIIFFTLLKLNISSTLPINFLNCYIGSALIFFTFYNIYIDKENLHRYFQIFIIFSFINLIIGIIEYNSSTNILGDYYFRMDGFYFPPLFNGMRIDGLFKIPEMFIINCDLAIICILQLSKDRGRKNIGLLVVPFLCANVICFYTFNLIFLVFIYFFTSKNKVGFKIAIILVMALCFLFYKNNEYFSAKSVGSYYTRIGGYIYNLNKIKESPFFGQSKSEEHYYQVILDNGIIGNTAPHNVILEILVDGGLFLLIIVLILFIYIMKKIKTLQRDLKIFFIGYWLIYGAIFAIFVLTGNNDILYALLGCEMRLNNDRLTINTSLTES